MVVFGRLDRRRWLPGLVLRRPADAWANSRGRGTPRVTFLVNVWLNHKPKSVSPLPEKTAVALTSGRLELDVSNDTRVSPAIIKVLHETVGGVPGIEKVQEGTEVIPETEENDIRREAVDSDPPTSVGCTGTCRTEAPGNAGVEAIKGSVSGSGEEMASCVKIQDISGDAEGVNSTSFRCCNSAARRSAKFREDREVLKMRWEFGELGAESGKQVHVRHDVVMPVPVCLTPAAAAGARDADKVEVSEGESFCVVFPIGMRPRVLRVGVVDGLSESEESDSEEEEDESDEEDEKKEGDD